MNYIKRNRVLFSVFVWSGFTFIFLILGEFFALDVLQVLPFWVFMFAALTWVIYTEKCLLVKISFNDILKIGLKVSVLSGITFSLLMLIYIKINPESFGLSNFPVQKMIPMLIMKFLGVGFLYSLLLAIFFKNK